MNSPRPVVWLRVLRTLASPPLLAGLAAAMLFAHAIVEVGRTALRGEQVARRIEGERVRIAALTAVAGAGHLEEGAPQRALVGGVDVTVERRGDRLFVDCASGPDGCRSFTAELLPGAAPALLGRARTVLAGDLAAMPKLDADALAAAPRAGAQHGFTRDRGLALLHLRNGTDREDFVLRPGADGASAVTGGGLLVVPGNLWFAPATDPLTIHLAEDLVLVVQGNCYLGRSLTVHGGGRLLLVAQTPEGSSVFADRDGSGGWSAGDQLRSGDRFHGPVEGGGAVYLGLPGRHCPLVFDVGVVVGGELNVLSPATVSGPMVMAFGTTSVDAPAEVPAGRSPWVFAPQHQRIPGFAVTGGVRPSLLRPAKSGDQTLYLGAPAR